MPDLDPAEHAVAMLDVKNQLIESLTAELARTTILLRNATSALAKVLPEEGA